MSRLALSLKQPWAALLVAGRKTIEVRRWATAYRGELLIHAAGVDDERPDAWKHVDDKIRPLSQLRGGVIGIGVLTAVKRYRDRAGFLGDQSLHLNEPDWWEERGLYGFQFDQIHPVVFQSVPGYIRLFEIDIDPPERLAPLVRTSPAPLPSPAGAGPLAAVMQRFRRLTRSLSRRPTEEE